jgi:hypothetical protein
VLPGSLQERTGGESQTDSESQDSAAKDSSDSTPSQSEQSFEKQFKAHVLPLKDNPVIGTYRTSGGVLLTLTESGEYRWEEADYLVKGEYRVSEGTIGQDEYVLESDTGPLYTVLVNLQTSGDFEEGQIKPNTEVSVWVFDFYNTDVWRVTDMMSGTQFEATRI